jgi:hypothetical protein
MALNPSLSFSVQNDNKKLTVTDTTPDYGVGANIAVTDITTLTLDIIITTSDEVAVTYDAIDLYALNTGPFALQSELVFEITPDLLEISGVAAFTSDDEFPDGVYNVTYSINTPAGVKEYDVLMDGRVTNSTYELLRLMPQSYLCGKCNDKEVLDVMFTFAMIDAMESAAYVGNNESILEQLYVIERLVTNGSTYTW